MLNRLLKFLVTSTVLLTMAVAGLPVVVCVSEAHGMMIEVGGRHVEASTSSTNHHALFGGAEPSAHSEPCSDFHLERGTIANQSRENRPSLQIPSGGVSFPALASPSLRPLKPVPISIRASTRTLASSLRERRTIVLLI